MYLDISLINVAVTHDFSVVVFCPCSALCSAAAGQWYEGYYTCQLLKP